MMEENPLDCVTCFKELQDPLLLPCKHTVCSKCSECKLCGPSTSKGAPDELAAFLIEASKETSDACANCDQVARPMFYCETCQQYLCIPCRNETHKAKMFSSHKVINAEERNKVYGKSNCEIHGDPFILYSEESDQLMCIQCFNSFPVAERNDLLSIGAGHKTCLEKIEELAVKLRSFQKEKQEELHMRQRILQGNERLFLEKKTTLEELCQQIIDTVVEVRESIKKELDEKVKEGSEACEEQANRLQAVLKPIRLCLFSSQILCNSASSLDVLHLNGKLHSRCQEFLTMTSSPGRLPSPLSFEQTDYRAVLAKALEPFLGISAGWCPMLSAQSSISREGSSASYKRGSGSQKSMPMFTKYQSTIDLAGEFGQLFGRVAHPIRQLIVDLALASQKVLEMQKDLTKRRCLIDKTAIDELINDSRKIETDLGFHSSTLDNMQGDMQLLWQEQLDRVRRQQILFREKIDEVFSLRETARQVLNAAKSLAPYVTCITTMNAVIDPKRCHPPDPAPMESICLQITGIEPDSESRILAIEKEEENRRVCQEAKRKEQVTDIDCVVKTLKHGKGRRKEQNRAVINTNRERSPGGTDIALLSPCNTSRMSIRDDLSEGSIAENWEEEVEVSGNQQCENIDSSFEQEQFYCCELAINVSQMESKVPLASRVTHDVGTCRQSMLQSLNDVFAAKKAAENEKELSVSVENALLASAVKLAEKKKREEEISPVVTVQEKSQPIVQVMKEKSKKTKKRMKKKGREESLEEVSDSSVQ